MVLDVPRHLIIWDRWNGRYGDFAAGRRINLATLHTRPDDIALLCDIFEQPDERDLRSRAQAVTKEIAAKLAELSAVLESRVGDQERVARFPMRCVFSCFAEDVGLLPKRLFERTLTTARDEGGPNEVGEALSLLWKTMDEGERFGADKVQHFNGHFFKAVEAIRLEPREVDLLIEAAQFDWSHVEPSIFGTLLVRALDPEERHRLGAEFTPREYIERLVEPTVVEPIRERWTAVQAAVMQMNPVADDPSTKKTKAQRNAEGRVRDAAIKELLEFHRWLRMMALTWPRSGQAMMPVSNKNAICLFIRDSCGHLSAARPPSRSHCGYFSRAVSASTTWVSEPRRLQLGFRGGCRRSVGSQLRMSLLRIDSEQTSEGNRTVNPRQCETVL
jgi:hypothetical protein